MVVKIALVLKISLNFKIMMIDIVR